MAELRPTKRATWKGAKPSNATAAGILVGTLLHPAFGKRAMKFILGAGQGPGTCPPRKATQLNKTSACCSAPCSRTPQYAGSCTTALSCNTTQYVDGQGKTQVQYLCQGTSLDSDSCGDQCDTQQLCTALCSCDMVCGTEQVRVRQGGRGVCCQQGGTHWLQLVR